MTTYSESIPHPMHDAGPYRFERRRADRWQSDAHATAFCLSGDTFGRIADLRLMDHSHDGMGAISPHPLEPGTEISIGFAAPGYLARRGTVLRCEPCGEGYRIAVQFQARLAA
jgi:hypothetical protein